MSLLINLGIDKWTESMLSITSSQKCSLIHASRMAPRLALLGDVLIMPLFGHTQTSQ